MGVDPDTLRRWADDGLIEAYVTPGGHRRFDQKAIARLVAGRRSGHRPLASMGASPERLARAYRRTYTADAAAHQVPADDTAERERYRRDGRRLVEALVAHLDAADADADARARAEAEANALVDDLAHHLKAAGMSLTEAVGLFVAARRPFLDELTGLGRRRALDAARLGGVVRERIRAARPAAPAADRDVPGGARVNPSVILPALTSILALVFAVALFDQWRERRGGFQLIWTLGMVFYGIGAGCEAIAAASGWNEALYRTWYLTGAVWTAGWLGLGTAYLLGRTRFGYCFAACLFLAGLFTFLVRNKPEYAGAGTLPLLYFIAAGLLALAVAVETYFANERWPALAAAAVVGATAAEHRADGHDDAGRARLRGRSGHRCADRDAVPALAAAADAVPQHHRGVRADPGCHLLDLRVHAQAPGAGLLARSEPARRRVPVQPADRAGRDHGQPRRVAAGRGPGARSPAGCTAGSRPPSSSRSARSWPPWATPSTGSG